jgi:hypothetical protein
MLSTLFSRISREKKNVFFLAKRGVACDVLPVMNIQFDITGTETVGVLLSRYQAIVPDGKAKEITLTFSVASSVSEVKKSASVSSEDTAHALASLTPSERLAVEKFQALQKAHAAQRVEGQTSERWKSSIMVRGESLAKKRKA